MNLGAADADDGLVGADLHRAGGENALHVDDAAACHPRRCSARRAWSTVTGVALPPPVVVATSLPVAALPLTEAQPDERARGRRRCARSSRCAHCAPRALRHRDHRCPRSNPPAPPAPAAPAVPTRASDTGSATTPPAHAAPPRHPHHRATATARTAARAARARGAASSRDASAGSRRGAARTRAGAARTDGAAGRRRARADRARGRRRRAVARMARVARIGAAHSTAATPTARDAARATSRAGRVDVAGARSAGTSGQRDTADHET